MLFDISNLDVQAAVQAKFNGDVSFVKFLDNLNFHCNTFTLLISLSAAWLMLTYAKLNRCLVV